MPRPEARPAPALRPLDIAYGIPLGNDPVPPLARSSPGVTPKAAIGQVLADALSRTPCLLSFSGGRDSSALLAAAVDVARREGLDLPVPATLVFPESEESNEDEWQAIVLRHLGVTEWERFEIHQEFDAVGPVATQALLRHGLLWPFNTHFHAPIIERAAGGSVVTGFGGDELGNSLKSARAEQLLASRRLKNWRDLLVLGLALSPTPVRAAVHRRRARADMGELPWLTDEGARQLVHAYGQSEATIPLGWESKVRRWIWPGRYFRVCVESFAALGSYHDVEVVHPFVDGRVLDALGAVGWLRGTGGPHRAHAARLRRPAARRAHRATDEGELHRPPVDRDGQGVRPGVVGRGRGRDAGRPRSATAPLAGRNPQPGVDPASPGGVAARSREHDRGGVRLTASAGVEFGDDGQQPGQ